MLDDGLRPRTKGLAGLPVGSTAVDLEGGSPRKNHGLGHTFGGGIISSQKVLEFCNVNNSFHSIMNANDPSQELEGPFFEKLTNYLLIGGAIAAFVLFWMAGLAARDVQIHFQSNRTLCRSTSPQNPANPPARPSCKPQNPANPPA